AVPLMFFGPLYTAAPLALGIQLMWFNKLSFLFVMILVWMLDSAAYWIGSAAGRTKLAPSISPKKTWEGALGGLGGCFVTAILYKAFIPSAAFPLTWTEVISAAIAIGIVGQIADLGESALKRDAGVKDSGV